MHALRCSLLVSGLVLVACGDDTPDPAVGSGAATESTTSSTVTTTDVDEPASDGGLGESVGVTDEVTITVLED